ncbi:MAG TPA: DUF4231 domain-containing protein [Geobacteraceae bacterium]
MLVDQYLAKLNEQTFFASEDMEGSVRWYIKWYRKHAPRKRNWFRTFGIVTIVMSISLPFITGLVGEEHKATVASSIAWIIALSGSINGFFQFNKTWQKYIETQFKLEQLLMDWELGTAALLGESDDKSLRCVQELTQTFVKLARAAITDETKSYFEEVKFPEINAKK